MSTQNDPPNARKRWAPIRVGDVQTTAFISGIYGTTTGSTTTLPVIVDSNGQLGTAVSSQRFKKDIKPMQEVSESILALVAGAE
jgi:hypothetical protein